MTHAAPWRAARGTWTGLVCGLGGVVGHHLVSASVPTPYAALVVLATVAAGWTTARRRLDPAAVLGLALVAQVLTHGALAALVPAPPHAHGSVDPLLMLLVHLLVALGSTALAVGGEDALLRLASGLLRRVAPPVVGAAHVPPALRDVVVPDDERAPAPWVGQVRPCRGPPARALLPTSS